MGNPPLRLSESVSVAHQESHEVHAGYWLTDIELADGGRLRLMQASDPDRRWAKGGRGTRWRQRTWGGRRFDWRQEDDECVVCERQGDVLLWLRGRAMTLDEVLAVAQAVGRQPQPQPQPQNDS